MSRKVERRFFVVDQLRATADEEKVPKISGYAAVFNKISEDLGGFREKIKFGAFSDSIVDDDIRALFNHDPNFVLGRSANNTLELMENRHGLKVEITPPGTQWANDLLVSINRGDISQMSFGFSVLDDAWEMKDGENLRTLKKVRLYDVSPVTFAAYPQTKVNTNSIDVEATRRLALRIDNGLPLTEDDLRLIGLLERVCRLREMPECDADLCRRDRLTLYTQLINGSDSQGSSDRDKVDDSQERSTLSLKVKELELARIEGEII